MTREMRMLGIAVLAACAAGAMLAAGASAHQLKINGERGSADLTGTGSSFFVGMKSISGGFESTCTHSQISASAVPKGAEKITVASVYTDCTETIDEHFAPVETGACTYALYGTTASNTNTNGTQRTTAPVDIQCGSGSIKITPELLPCPIEIPSQTARHGVTYENLGAGEGEYVTITYSIDNIHYKSSGSFSCSLLGVQQTGTDMFFTGTEAIKGYETGSAHAANNQVGITFK